MWRKCTEGVLLVVAAGRGCSSPAKQESGDDDSLSDQRGQKQDRSEASAVQRHRQPLLWSNDTIDGVIGEFCVNLYFSGDFYVDFVAILG